MILGVRERDTDRVSIRDARVLLLGSLHVSLHA
jgi:hypothetical protein